MPDRLYFTDSDESNALIATDPMALLIGFADRSLLRTGPVRAAFAGTAPFHLVNSYGLFAVMTTTRPEIVVQGSADGETWLDYGFPWKPGDPGRRPRFDTAGGPV